MSWLIGLLLVTLGTVVLGLLVLLAIRFVRKARGKNE